MATRNPLQDYIAANLAGLVRPPSGLGQMGPSPQALAVDEWERKRAGARAGLRAAAAVIAQQNQERQATAVRPQSGIGQMGPSPQAQAQSQLQQQRAAAHAAAAAQLQGQLAKANERRIIQERIAAAAASGVVNPALVQQIVAPPDFTSSLSGQYEPSGLPPGSTQPYIGPQPQPVQPQPTIDPNQAVAEMIAAGALPEPTTPVDPNFVYDPNRQPERAGVDAAIASVGGQAQDYAEGVKEAGKEAFTQAVYSGAQIAYDPSLGTVKDQIDPMARQGVGVVGAVSNLPGINVLYEKNVDSVGRVAYERAKGVPGQWTDPGTYNPTQYGDTDWLRWRGDEANKATIVNAFENGIDSDGDGTIDLKGGQAVYAEYLGYMASLPGEQGLFFGKNSLLAQLVRAAVLDPLTYGALLSGGSTGIVRSLGRKVSAGGTLTASEKILFYAARVGQAAGVPERVADAPFALIGKTAQGIGAGINRATGGRLDPRVAGQLPVQTQVNVSVAQTDEAIQNLIAARQAAVGGQPTPGQTASPLPPAGAGIPQAQAATLQPTPGQTASPLSPVGAVIPPGSAPIPQPTVGQAASPLTPAQQGNGNGSGQYERVQNGTKYGILDPNGTVIEWVTPKGIVDASGTIVRPLPPGAAPGAEAIKRRNELNAQLGKDQQAVGLDALGPEPQAAPEVTTTPTESGNGATFRVPTRKAVLDPNGPETTPDGQRFRWATTEEATQAQPTVGQTVPPSQPATDPLTGHWLDPKTGRKDPQRVEARPSVYEWVDLKVRPVAPEKADAFDAAYKADPRLPEFQEKMRKHDEEAQRVARADAQERGRNPETVQGFDTPEKVLDMAAHVVEVQRPIARQTIGETPPYRFDYGDDLDRAMPPPDKVGKGFRARASDERVVVERAVFGTDADAARSRRYLRLKIAELKGLIDTSTTIEQRTPYLRQQAKYLNLLDETTRLRNMEIEAGGTTPNPQTGAPATVPNVEGELPGMGRAAPTFGETPSNLIDVPPQSTAPTLDLQTQVLDTPAAQRQAEVLNGQTDMFGGQPSASSASSGVPGEETVPTASLTTQPAMQPRKTLNRVKADRYGREWNWNKYQRIDVWRDPATGKDVVLAGHHRFEGAKSAGIADLPIKRFEGTRTEAIAYARRSNSQADELAPTEAGKALRDEMDNGSSYTEALAEYPSVKSNQAKDYLELTHLPEDLQELVDGGQVSVKKGALLGKAVREGTLSPAEVQTFYRNRVLKMDYSDRQLTSVLDILKQMKTKLTPQEAQAGLFGGMDLGGADVARSLDLIEDMALEKRKLAGKEKAYGVVAGDAPLSPEQTAKLDAIRARIDAIQAELDAGNPAPAPIKPKRTRKPKGTVGIVPDELLAFWRLLDQAGPRANISAEVPGIATPLNNVDQLFDEGGIDAQTRETLNRPIQVNGIVMSVADYFDEQAAIYGETVGRQKALRTIRVLENQRLGVADPEDATKLGKAWDAFQTASAITRETVQFNIVTGWRRTPADMISDGYILSVTGHGAAAAQQFDPRARAAAFRAVRDTDNAGVLNNLEVAAPMRETGELLPLDVLPRGSRSDTPLEGETTLHRQVMKVTGGRGKRFTGTLTGVFANRLARDLASAGDAHRRMVLYLDQWRTSAADARASWEGLMRQTAQRTGNDADQWLTDILDTARARVEADGGEWQGMFSPQDILSVTGQTNLSRAWKNELSKVKRAAKAETDRVMFSYKYTNADQALSNGIFFHYWQSRAIALHARTAIKNPWLMATYWRTWQILKEKAEEEGYPPSVLGYLRFMGDSTEGMFGLFDPVGMLVPYRMFAEWGGNEDAPWWKRIAPFINPWIMGAGAAFGMTDTVPDPTGTWSVRNAARTVFDWGNANGIDFLPGGDAPSGDFLQTVERKVYEGANAALRGIGVPAKAFQPYDPRTNQIVQLRDRVEQIAQDTFGPRQEWTPDEIAKVDDAKVRVGIDAKGNPLSEQAWKEYTAFQVGATAIKSVMPGGAVFINADLTGRRKDANAFFDNLEGGTTTPEQEAAADAMAGTNAGSPEAMTLGTEQNAYNEIGTERQQALADGWRVLAYDTDIPQGIATIGGKVYYSGQILAMPEEARKVLADQWVRENDGTAELRTYREERKAYVASHPEYQGFDTYQGAVRGEDGGARGFRNRAEKDHPEFADELAKAREDYKKEGKTGGVLENELDEWTVSAKGYNAFRGVRQSIYDDAPKKAYDPSKDAFGGSWGAAAGKGGSDGGNEPYNKGASLKKQLATYQAKMAAASDLLGTDATRLSPMAEKAYSDILPKASSDLLLYMEWATSQPPGADNTVDAYLLYVDELEDAA